MIVVNLLHKVSAIDQPIDATLHTLLVVRRSCSVLKDVTTPKDNPLSLGPDQDMETEGSRSGFKIKNVI